MFQISQQLHRGSATVTQPVQSGNPCMAGCTPQGESPSSKSKGPTLTGTFSSDAFL